MSACEFTAKGTMSGNNVSHSERKTRRKFKVNIQSKVFFSDSMQTNYTFKVCARAIKTIDKCGGLDAYLLKTPNELLSEKARMLKNKIKDKQAA